MSEQQLELNFTFEQSEEAKQLESEIANLRQHVDSAEYLHKLLMESLRNKIRDSLGKLQKVCTHPKTTISVDHNWHKNEDWNIEKCDACGTIVRKW